jgi:hypothetical protein
MVVGLTIQCTLMLCVVFNEEILKNLKAYKRSGMVLRRIGMSKKKEAIDS